MIGVVGRGMLHRDIAVHVIAGATCFICSRVGVGTNEWDPRLVWGGQVRGRMCQMWQCWRSAVVPWQPWRCTDSWPVGWAWTSFDEQSLQWALDVCHSLRVCMSIPEPGETWEEMILDEGAYFDNSQVRVPHLWWKWLWHPKVLWAYSCLVSWSWTSSKHSEVVVNKEGVWLKLLTLVDSCCLSMFLVAQAVAMYTVFESARQSPLLRI